MNAFWFSLAVNTSFFLADVFIKLGSSETTAARLIFVRSIFTVLLASIWGWFAGDFNAIPNTFTFLQLIFCSILCTIGLYYYIKALLHLHFVNVAVIGICGAFIHYGLGVFLYHETIVPYFYLAAALSVAGILLQWKKNKDRKGLYEAILSAIAWGFGYALLSIPLAQASAIWGTWTMEFTTLLLSIFYLLVYDKSYKMYQANLKQWKIVAVALFTIFGSILINISYQKFALNMLGFMQLAFFPYSLLAGHFLFKEKLSKIEWQGIALILSGLVIYFLTCTN